MSEPGSVDLGARINYLGAIPKVQHGVYTWLLPLQVNEPVYLESAKGLAVEMTRAALHHSAAGIVHIGEPTMRGDLLALDVPYMAVRADRVEVSEFER